MGEPALQHLPAAFRVYWNADGAAVMAHVRGDIEVVATMPLESGTEIVLARVSGPIAFQGSDRDWTELRPFVNRADFVRRGWREFGDGDWQGYFRAKRKAARRRHYEGGRKGELF